jgi:hypothetical protein
LGLRIVRIVRFRRRTGLFGVRVGRHLVLPEKVEKLRLVLGHESVKRWVERAFGRVDRQREACAPDSDVTRA